MKSAGGSRLLRSGKDHLDVLALVPDAYGGMGGISRFNRHFLDVLSSMSQLRMTALSLLGTQGVPVPAGLRWSVAEGSQARFAVKALQFCGSLRPDILVSGHVGFGPVAVPLAKATRARLVAIVHGIEAWAPAKRRHAFALKRADQIISVSQYTLDRVRGWSGLPEERFEILHNAAPLDQFRPGPRPLALAERLGISNEKVLLTVGRLSAQEGYKGHDRVIRVLSRIAREVGPLRYLVVGDGDDRPRLEALAKTEGVSNRVQFISTVDDKQLPEFYRLADVFVMPSTGEGFGIVFLEAMATGCPVVAGNVDGSVDAVRGAERGWLVDPYSPDELAKAIVAACAAGRFRNRAVGGVERFSVVAYEENLREIVRRRWLV